MSWADLINGSYEFTGGILVLLNCWRLYKDKQVKGVSIFTAGFFSTWSWWNLYYYPSLDQWMSFIGGMLLGITNAVWVGMAIYYERKIICENLKKVKIFNMITRNMERLKPSWFPSSKIYEINRSVRVVKDGVKSRRV